MQINWYLKGNSETEGPFSEPEIRARLLSGAYSPGAEVKQGESAWRPADEVKQLFVRIYQEGWYVKHKDKTAGPFITQKLLDLHQTGKLPKRAMVRQGSSTTWLPASDMIQSLQQKQTLLAQLNQTIAAESKPSLQSGDEGVVVAHDEPHVVEDELEEIENGEAFGVQVKVSKPIPSRIPIAKPISTLRPAPSARPIAMAQVVVPAPSPSLTLGDLFRDLPTSRPVATPSIPVKPNYSHPIVSRYQSPSTPPSVQSQSDVHGETMWRMFRWLIGLVIVPRVIEGLLVLLTGLSGNGLPLFAAYSIFAIEVNACFVVLVAIGVWGIVLAFRESVEQGLLYLFIPFYSFYYVISRWDRCWGMMLLACGAAIWAFAIAACPLIAMLVLMNV